MKKVRWSVVLSGGLLGLACTTTSTPQTQTARWSAAAAADAEHVMHEFHVAWNKMDMETIQSYIADDGFLTTFEFTDSQEAVALQSKAELVAWLEKGFKDLKDRDTTTVAAPTVKMECRATDTIAFCTEQCDIKFLRPDGLTEVSPHRGTSILRKGADGWKYVHWHVSESATRRLIDQEGKEVALSR